MSKSPYIVSYVIGSNFKRKLFVRMGRAVRFYESMANKVDSIKLLCYDKRKQKYIIKRSSGYNYKSKVEFNYKNVHIDTILSLMRGHSTFDFVIDDFELELDYRNACNKDDYGLELLNYWFEVESEAVSCGGELLECK